MKYRVLCREVWVRPFDVEAVNQVEAIAKVNLGIDCVDLEEIEFSHQLSTDCWTAEEVKDNFPQLQTERWINNGGI